MSESEFQKKLLAGDGIAGGDAEELENVRRVQARESVKMKWAKRAVIGLWVLYVISYAAAGITIQAWRASRGDDVQAIDRQVKESAVAWSLYCFGYVLMIVTVWWLIRYAFFRFRQIQFALTDVQASLERINRRLDSVEKQGPTQKPEP